MVKQKTFLNWSGGKDATLSLYFLSLQKKTEVDLLFTVLSKEYDRVTMHGLHRSLVEAQAKSLGLEVQFLLLNENPSMEDYDRLMTHTLKQLSLKGYGNAVFGDIFLEDLRTYRENLLKPLNLKPLFPLWKKDTRKLMHDFIAAGFKAIVVCCHSGVLPKSFCGRELNESFLNDLPENVDPCGENGEYHTFCYDGPVFSEPISFTTGELVYKTYPAPKTGNANPAETYGFWYIDLKLIRVS